MQTFNKIKKCFTRKYNRYQDEISYKEAIEMLKNEKNIYLIDVRSSQENKEYHLPNSINLPVYNIEKDIKKVVRNLNSIIILYCQTGVRSRKALIKLKKIGYLNVYNLKGGVDNIENN